jgi:c-di-GMP-binding flagellar brake protein YcgR
MLLSQIVQVGEMLDIRVEDVTTKTKLQEILDSERFVVSYPTYRMIPMLLDENETVRFSFARSNGMYTFQAVFTEKFTRDNLKYCIFQAITEVEKNQRRYGYRLPVVLNISLRVIESDKDEKSPEILAKTVNLSEKGALFSCYQRFSKGTKLAMQLRLDKYDVLFINAEVLRCEPPIRKNEPYLIAVQFYNYSKQDQTHIGRYILKRQIIQRKARDLE